MGLDFWSKLGSVGFASTSDKGAPAFESLPNELHERFSITKLNEAKSLSPLSMDEAPANSLSSKFGYSEQPFHSDCANWPKPPRYLSIFCVNVGHSPVATDVLAIDWVEVEGAESSILKDKVFLFQAREKAGVYSSILQKLPDVSWRVRYDPTLMKSDIETEVLDSLMEFGKCHRFELSTGDWILIDNYKALHRRGEVPADAISRRVIRQYWG